MFTIKQLEQKKQDIVELNDLPIEDFVGWDGWERMIDSHIKVLQEIEKLKNLYDFANKNEDYSDFYNHMHFLTYGYVPKN